MKGQVPFEFCLKILHFFFFGCVFDHPKKLCFKIWKSSIKICRFCTDFDDDFGVDWQSVFYNLLIINIWATTGTRTPDLLITNELLYQLSYGGRSEATEPKWKIANASAKVLLFCEICKYFCVFGYFFVILSAERIFWNKNTPSKMATKIINITTIIVN